jgi:hypothetical protein
LRMLGRNGGTEESESGNLSKTNWHKSMLTFLYGWTYQHSNLSSGKQICSLISICYSNNLGHNATQWNIIWNKNLTFTISFIIGSPISAVPLTNLILSSFGILGNILLFQARVWANFHASQLGLYNRFDKFCTNKAKWRCRACCGFMYSFRLLNYQRDVH